MAGASLDQDDIIAEINITPLVDVSLVLVIIFMVVAPFLTHLLKPLNLPPASQATLTEQNTLNISIFPDGDIALGASVVQEAQLGNAIKQAIAQGKKPWALVRAGSEVSHGRVMDIMKVLKISGIERIAFATEPKITPESSEQLKDSVKGGPRNSAGVFGGNGLYRGKSK